jgi:hypothetical protein
MQKLRTKSSKTSRYRRMSGYATLFCPLPETPQNIHIFSIKISSTALRARIAWRGATVAATARRLNFEACNAVTLCECKLVSHCCDALGDVHATPFAKSKPKPLSTRSRNWKCLPWVSKVSKIFAMYT